MQRGDRVYGRGQDLYRRGVATVTVPRGTLTTSSVKGAQWGWLLVLYSPAGFEGYFEERGEYLQSLPPEPPVMEEVQEKVAKLSEVDDQTIVHFDWLHVPEW